jgi:hypothetical protein
MEYSSWQDDFARNQAKEMFARAADSQDFSLGTNDILSLVGTKGKKFDSTWSKVLGQVLQLLLCDFWARIQDNDSPHPTLAEPLLILQLHKALEFEKIKRVMEEF